MSSDKGCPGNKSRRRREKRTRRRLVPCLIRGGLIRKDEVGLARKETSLNFRRTN